MTGFVRRGPDRRLKLAQNRLIMISPMRAKVVGPLLLNLVSAIRVSFGTDLHPRFIQAL